MGNEEDAAEVSRSSLPGDAMVLVSTTTPDDVTTTPVEPLPLPTTSLMASQMAFTSSMSSADVGSSGAVRTPETTPEVTPAVARLA